MIHSLHFGQPIIYYLLAGMAIATFACLATAPSPRVLGEGKFEVLFILSAGAALFAGRWPILLWPDELNVDESTFIACALKATVDWVPWRGFDASTSGPLNPDILTLPALFGADIGFFSARVVGLGLIAGAICALYFAVKWIYGPGVARLSILPPVVLLSFTKAYDFVHYSSEHFPIFLTTVPLAAAAWLARGGESRTSRLIACATAGLFLGSAPLAKLQSAPIALAVLILLVAAIFITPPQSSNIQKLEVLFVLAGLVAIPSFVLISLLTTGGFEDAVISYYKMTLVFVKGRPPVPKTLLFFSVQEYTFFWVASLAVIVASGAALYSRVTFTRTFLWASLSSILLLLASLFAIQHAHHAFPHYLLFSIIPVSFCGANMLGLLYRTGFGKKHAVLARSLFVALFLAPIGFAALTSETDFSTRAMAPMRKDVIAVSRYVKPGDRLGVWAWRPDYYVKTRTIMATRSAGILVLLEPSRYREYFRNRFLSDLRANPPPVFVDGVAPGAFLPDRATQGIESFPLLEAFVREHYTQREEVAGVRIFVANNLR
jgi:hypothetical protein